ncbi:hypothetical protein B0J13DRAFT_654490 [Dactylonectria estremocensis]|uniref:Fucose-specific lectin n=1 Tax=Dactylonectria estremocensis TaxID=1079267 RepID=A0A9P9F7X7_9HYPO|nr:hypothetical protein B0J13DRAFT_654490 [Dactylonectria estremocensis]
MKTALCQSFRSFPCLLCLSRFVRLSIVQRKRLMIDQRDDERYPIVVSGLDDAKVPEALTTPQRDLEGRDKVVVERASNGLIPKFDDAQKEVITDKNDVGGDIRGDEALLATLPTRPRTCYGMKRRNFFIAIAVLAAVLVAAIVGGIVGGLRSNGSNSDDNGADSGSSPTSTGAAPSETGPIDADEWSMPAAIVTDEDNQNSQVFYNDLDTRDIHFRRIQDDEGTSEYTLDLDIEPNWGAPMAAAAGTASSSSSIETKLYYVVTSDNETQIAQAVMNCGSIDADDEGEEEEDDEDNTPSSTPSGPCSLTSNSIISTNLTNGVHPSTRLAALRLANDSMRVYFQAPGANIWIMQNDDGDDQWIGSNLVGDVFAGSSIVIDENPGSGWSPSATFASIYGPDFESYRVYYTNPLTGTIIPYFQNTTTAWSSNYDANWGEPDASIAAVSWENQVRLLYFQNGTLVLSSQDVSSWDTPEEVGGKA